MDIRTYLHNPRIGRAVGVVVLSLMMLALLNFTTPFGDTFFETSNTLLSPVVAFIGAFVFFQVRRSEKDAASIRLWTAMAAGLFLWGLADAIWAFFEVFLQVEAPYPSFADLLWIVAYPVMFAGLYARLKSLRVHPSKSRIALIRALAAFWLVLTAAFVLRPILSDFSSDRLLEGLVNIFYPLGDLALVIFASYYFILLNKGRYALAWRLIFAGLMLMTASDLLFSYATWNDLYYPESGLNLITVLIETTYISAYVISALGGYVYIVVTQIKESMPVGLETRAISRLHALLLTNHDHSIITASNNFGRLVEAEPWVSYSSVPLHHALGLDEPALKPLMDKMTAKSMVCNELFTLKKINGSPIDVWVTAQPIYDTDNEYRGANILLRSDMPVPDDLRFPDSNELTGIVKHLVSLSGNLSKDADFAERVRFTENIRLLSTLLYQFGGETFQNALFAELDTAIVRNHLHIQCSGQTLTIPEEYEGEVLANALKPLLQAARDFATTVLGAKIVTDELKELEEQLALS